MLKRKTLLAIVSVVILMFIMTGATVAYAEANQYHNFVSTISTAEAAYQEAANELEETIQNIPDNTLIHTNLKTTAEQVLTEQPQEYKLNPYLEKVLQAIRITPEYPLWQDQQLELQDWYNTQIEILQTANDNLKADHAAWTLQKAKNNLIAIIDEAQDALDTIQSDLTKPELATDLTDLIAKARAELNTCTDPSQFRTYQTDIRKSIEDLQENHGAYIEQKEREAAEAAAREKAEQEAAAQAVTQTTETTFDPSEIWNVSYVPSYFTAAAPADGSVGEWQPGYYIAHDWSVNGQRIASKPTHVIVDGQIYHYVSSMIVPPETTWDVLSAFACVNGGIGFQTCYGADRLVTHYEPGE